MLLGGNFGFWYSVVVVVFGWFLGRWKWRCVAARREEIRRLMMLASEETARAEIEAASGYRIYGSAVAAEPMVEEPVTVFEGPVAAPGSYPGRKLQYQCEMCFSPTTTRCKQCKAAHYCSRKCQILHWHQGHKDECSSITTHRTTDTEVHSHYKEFKKEGIDNCDNVIEVLHNIKPVKSSPEKRVSSNPTLYIPDLNSSGNTKHDVGTRKHLSGQPNSVIDEHTPDASSVSNHVNSSCIGDEKSKSLNSGSWATDSKEYFYEVERSLTKVHTEISGSDMNGVVGYGPRLDSIPTMSSTLLKVTEDGLKFKKPLVSSGEVPGQNGIRTSVHDSSNEVSKLVPSIVKGLSQQGCVPCKNVNNLKRLQSVGPKVADLETDGANCVLDPLKIKLDTLPRMSNTLSEVGKDGLKSKVPLVSNGKVPDQNDITGFSVQGSSKEESKLSPSIVKGLSEEGHVPCKKVGNLSNLPSVGPKVVDREADGEKCVLDPSKIQPSNFTRQRYSKTPMPSDDATNVTTILDAQSMKNVHAHEDDSCSLDGGGYVHVMTNRTNHRSSRRDVDDLRDSNFTKGGSLGAGAGAGTGIIGKYEGLFPYELFVKLYHWNKVELRPRGLKNCGNSCYVNAVLQCLACTPPLTAYFLEGLHSKTCQNKEWCFPCDFELLVKKTNEGNYTLSPDRLMSQMQHLARHLGNGGEEDAHEFMKYAIDAMQNVCLKDAGVNVPSSSDEDTTLLGLTFGGYLQSKIECMRCGAKSKQHERTMDLTIEIGGGIGSLEDALRQFTRSEILDGENKYHCCRCKSYEKAKKRLRVLEAPNVLTIALKRFQLGEFGKLNKSVKFPKVLNLAPYMRGTSDKSPIYQLYGAVVHLDVKNTTFTGHYVCYVKNNRGRWFKADDSLVQAVEVERVLSNDAYMLFYARCSPRAPRPIRSSMDHRKSKNPTTNRPEFHPTEPWRDVCFRSSSEDDNLTENTSLFSDSGSHSTSSTAGDSIFSDRGTNCGFFSGMNTPSSSSSSLSSPMCTRHSPLADLDHYSSDAEDGFWAGLEMCRPPNKEFTCSRKSSVNFNSARFERDEWCIDGKLSGVRVRR